MSLVVKLRFTLSLLFGSTVRKERVSLIAPPKTLLQSLANSCVFEAKKFPVLELETACFKKMEKGREIIRLITKAESKIADKNAGIIPKNLLSVLAVP
jgi:hypothetical protein